MSKAKAIKYVGEVIFGGVIYDLFKQGALYFYEIDAVKYPVDTDSPHYEIKYMQIGGYEDRELISDSDFGGGIDDFGGGGVGGGGVIIDSPPGGGGSGGVGGEGTDGFRGDPDEFIIA